MKKYIVRARLPDKLRERIEGTKERDAQVNREWEAIGWKAVRFWEEELRDYRAVAEILATEIREAIDRIEERPSKKRLP